MKTTNKNPSDTTWKKLYELAGKVKELAPWEFLEEAELFGVKNPETEEIGFVSVMGLLGEHLSIGVYRGAEGLYGYWNVSDPDTDLQNNPFALFDIPQFQVSFEDREQLEKQDRDVIKKLGLKFRGSQNYPLFRSIHPGFMPYFVTAEEAKFLTSILEQTLRTAPRIKADEMLLPDPDENLYLVRVLENGVWKDEILSILPPQEFTIRVEAPNEIIDTLIQNPQTKGLVLEVDFSYVPMPVAEKGSRPFYPKMLMIAEAKQGVVMACDLIKPEENLIETHKKLPRLLMEKLQTLKMRPEEIRVKNNMMFEMLKSLTQQINIKLSKTDELPAIEMAQDEMFSFLSGGF